MKDYNIVDGEELTRDQKIKFLNKVIKTMGTAYVSGVDEHRIYICQEYIMWCRRMMFFVGGEEPMFKATFPELHEMVSRVGVELYDIWEWGEAWGNSEIPMSNKDKIPYLKELLKTIKDYDETK